ncbi:hypothetical protein HOG48_04695, partial [Candidatus Peregrinibacteria bacterium]|nr:hypothetical protein [Candidatus Peregrinibacteria bacterium]
MKKYGKIIIGGAVIVSIAVSMVLFSSTDSSDLEGRVRIQKKATVNKIVRQNKEIGKVSKRNNLQDIKIDHGGDEEVIDLQDSVPQQDNQSEDTTDNIANDNAPDLSITDMNFTPNGAVKANIQNNNIPYVPAGTEFFKSWQVNGQQPVSHSVNSGWSYVLDNLYSQSSVSEQYLDAGNTNGLSPSDTITACIDPTDVILETDESNNCLTKTVSEIDGFGSAFPDLSITDMSFTSAGAIFVNIQNNNTPYVPAGTEFFKSWQIS